LTEHSHTGQQTQLVRLGRALNDENMRLVIAQFDYLPDGDGVKICQPGKTRALARIVPDTQYPAMWRVVRPDGGLTDMVNKTRALDMAYGRAEIATYLRMTAECRPPYYGHFSTRIAPLMRSPGLGATTLPTSA
jgi:hypothetical protein